MKVKIIGIERKFYDFDGVKFDGNYIHCAKLEEPKEGLIGNVSVVIKIPDGHKCSSIPLSVGEKYIVYFDDKKKVDYIASCNVSK